MKSGVEFRSEWSSGPGYQFDVQNPPQVTFDGVNGFARPRSYDAIPSLVTSALYLDDRLYVPFGTQGLLTVQAGIRLDLLHEGSTWFSAVRDAKLGPRLNVEVSPRPWLRLRGGWGLMTKTPWLAQLYPAPQYYDVINVNWFTNDPAERLAVLTTFVEDPTNPELGFAVAEKAEAGIEVGPGSWAVSVVAFRDQVRNAVAARGMPGFLLRDHYDLTDSTRGTGVPPDIIEPPAFSDTVPILLAVPDNIMTVTSRGFELQAVLPEIPRLRTRLYVTGQWIETRQYVDALYFGSANRFGQFALSSTTPRTPYWGPVTEVGRRALLTYRVIHHQPALGLVLTAILQHNVFDYLEDVGPRDTLAFLGYVTRAGELVSVPESERGNPEFTDLRVPRSGTLAVALRTPADWMLSVQVSKTLPLDGRLSFWAFNALDREGTLPQQGGFRLYSRMRFGLELMVPVRGLLPWIY
jgi:TonB dependent receptor-like, beta-barrel